eukprot:CAMPEP_0182574778 /NCGR_PEP_ID=MMETSP1324-20130603/27351_1 /TAXON_ID=236786 /ORGANISM="Florenciella sp., Strain RCC1587" /LENGTH=47 /DNA_ID= /DNA_START= /DNA_END= /DNA_ORIENTATION=
MADKESAEELQAQLRTSSGAAAEVPGHAAAKGGLTNGSGPGGLTCSC